MYSFRVWKMRQDIRWVVDRSKGGWLVARPFGQVGQVLITGVVVVVAELSVVVDAPWPVNELPSQPSAARLQVEAVVPR